MATLTSRGNVAARVGAWGSRSLNFNSAADSLSALVFPFVVDVLPRLEAKYLDEPLVDRIVRCGGQVLDEDDCL